MTGPRRPGPTPPYCTIVERRQPRQKSHNTLAQARTALGLRLNGDGVRGGDLYEWDGSDWRHVAHVPPGTHPDDLPWRAGAAEQRKAAATNARAAQATRRHALLAPIVSAALADVRQDVTPTDAVVAAVLAAGWAPTDRP